MEWTVVAKQNELPAGKTKLVQIGKTMICVGNTGTRFFACEEMCPHRAGPLSEGKVGDNSITCPWHGAKFSIEDGTCQEGPAKRKLKIFPLEVQGEEIRVSLG